MKYEADEQAMTKNTLIEYRENHPWRAERLTVMYELFVLRLLQHSVPKYVFCRNDLRRVKYPNVNLSGVDRARFRKCATGACSETEPCFLLDRYLCCTVWHERVSCHANND